MSKHLPPSVNITDKDLEDVNLQLHISNHALLQVLLHRDAERTARELKVPIEKVKVEINLSLNEARVKILAEIDALYGK